MKEILVPAISTVVVALLSWLAERVITLINTKIKNQKLANYLTTATGVVIDAVKATQQEFVDDMKKTGKFDEEAQKEALLLAKTKALNGLSLETRNFINENMGDLDQWLTTSIHAILHDLKK